MCGVSQSKDFNTVGRRLKDLRTNHKFSQRKLADIAGVTQGLISQVEHGLRALPLRALERIVNTLHLDPRLILGDRRAPEALQALTDAWEAYDEGRSRHYSLLTKTLEISNFLRDHRAALFESLSTCAGPREHRPQDQFTTWASKEFQEGIKNALLPPKEEHYLYKRLPRAGLPGAEQFERILELAALANQMRAEDFDLVLRLVARLTRPRRAQRRSKPSEDVSGATRTAKAEQSHA